MGGGPDQPDLRRQPALTAPDGGPLPDSDQRGDWSPVHPAPDPAAPAPGPDRLLRSFVDAAEDAIVLTTPDAVVTAWNPGATRLYGHTAGEMVGRSLTEVTAAEDAEELTEVLDLLRRGVRVDAFDLRRIDRDGRPVDVSVTASAIPGPDGTVAAIGWVERDVTGRRHVERMISHLAFHDPLTGLANRMLLRDRMQHSLARTRRSGELVAVIYLDLDDFKLVNDRFGHPAGDRVLQLVATRLQGLLRPEDTLARLGGDEFVVMSDAVPSMEAALTIAERIAGALAPPFEIDDRRIAVAASIGVAVGNAEVEADRLLAHADRAMYAAKAAGGAAVAPFVAPPR